MNNKEQQAYFRCLKDGYVPIPVARARLEQLSEFYDIPELTELAAAMQRRKHKKERAPSTSNLCTPEMADHIRCMSATNPGLSNQEIADALGVNPGRVSEALAGER